MRIGELALRAGTSPRALRHYEQEGLLAARRRANGYRDYDEDDLRLVAEIRSLLAIGFTLDEARPFVDCLRSGHDRGVACPDAAAVHRRKIAEIDACVTRLAEIRAGLVGQLAEELGGRVAGAGTPPSGESAPGPRAPAAPPSVHAARAVPVPAAAPACALSSEQTQSQLKTYSEKRGNQS
ncbi:MerR family transcriptional regulator [Pseudofrankia sp. EUN1h]|uniref:MerR family transcriptional regulator n=2 Tax=Pseudofrankia TaxID=2994363 RepID=UPI0008D94A7F|nr:MerR family transcriptional regulator [Pseudofrankia sp. EUN1h]OHV32422.1 MerR family transcriptional regulator [Pseudofrankia sp. EUN1h]